MSGETNSVGLEIRSLAVGQATAIFIEDTTLLDTLELTASVPNWNVADYCARFSRLLDARRFAAMFLNG